MMQTVKRCPFWNYWSTQIVNDTLTKGMNYDELLKTIKRFTKMLEIQYYNHPGQTTECCYFAGYHASSLGVQPIKNKMKLLDIFQQLQTGLI